LPYFIGLYQTVLVLPCTLPHNKTTKLPALAIEVDGMAFHQAGSEQAKRDALKNSILDKVGIPLLRLSTDGSNEKNKIIKALSR